ncbi:fatty acyl-AMP ligase [Streptomyces sp. gCLA4]|uniref:fatty acyl-AMP ligase n=1 Tax=Streptomyces sp. gCLA4 TaxID=1873416 RepID=UPI0015FFB9DF|nr:fatty acyl-AMP ligase [Streptomyces sp. gCLA4]
MLDESLPPATPDQFHHETVVDAVRAHAERLPDHPLFTFLPDGDEAEPPLTFASLDARARAVAASLHAARAEPGARALLLFEPGQEFVVAFFGCLYAGVVAVPTYLPHPSQRARGLLRLAGIAEDAQPAAVLTTAGIQAAVETTARSVPEVRETVWLAVDTIAEGAGTDWSAPSPEPKSVAFLQYTSGSTGRPKGVMVTHGNLTHNSDFIRTSLGMDGSTVVVGWLPPYHDMGLISMIIVPAMMGIHSVSMPTVAFLQSPVRWLRAISTYRGTLSAAPNFAFDLCTRKVTDEDRASLDLSSWRVATNGAEPIRADSMQRFSEAFAATGFRPETIVPVYGLAESTLLVSGTPVDRPWVSRSFDEDALEHGTAVSVPADSPEARVLVSCGTSPALDVAIVDPRARTRCRPGQVGEIWVAGDSVAAGYWQRPDLTREAFEATLADGADQGPYLRTGDLGFRTEDGLFVCGRIKDVIIVGGRNHHPHDIERTAESAHPAIRPGCVAAFGVTADGTEEVVVAAELRRGADDGTGPEARQGVVNAVLRAVTQEHRLTVREVVLLPAGTLPKTSSGKLQRRETRKEYLAGRSPWNAQRQH